MIDEATDIGTDSFVRIAVEAMNDVEGSAGAAMNCRRAVMVQLDVDVLPDDGDELPSGHLVQRLAPPFE